MAHIGWFFLLDDDLDALDAELRSLVPAATRWTSQGRLQEHASLREAAAASRQVWFAEVPPGPDQPAVVVTTCLLQDPVLIGGDLGFAVAPADRTDAFEHLRAACATAYRSVARPGVVDLAGAPVSRYRFGRAAEAWWRAVGGRTLRDESVPTLTYALDSPTP